MQRLQIEPGDGGLWIEPDPDGDFVRADEAQEKIDRLKAALLQIQNSPYQSYEHSGSGQYGIGVADGHRYCARIAREVLDGEK